MSAHFYGDDCEGGHNRCQDFVPEPGVIYHAHDLPLCPERGVRLVAHRWLCERHAVERENMPPPKIVERFGSKFPR